MINYHYFEEIESTQLFAEAHLDEYSLPACIYAGKQTGGIGTHGRNWYSPKDVNVYATFIFALKDSFKNAHNLAQIMSLSVVAVLKGYKIKATLKWPNDILVDSKKIGGVLVQIKNGKALIGFGLNVNMNESDCSLIEQPVTSMKRATNTEFNPKEVLCRIGEQFLDDFDVFAKEGFAHFYDQYSNLMTFIGSRISFTLDGKEAFGFIESITKDGRINVKHNHTVITIASGSIVKSS